MMGHREFAAGCVASLALAASLSAQQQSAATGRVVGVVVTTDSTPLPVRRAVVSLEGGNLPIGKHTITDDNGRFVVEGLPEGRYEIWAMRPSFVTVGYGATRPGPPGAPLIIAAGQSVTDVKLLLARGAVITGIVRDSEGEPIRGIDVRVESRLTPGVTRTTTTVLTDDQGRYRVYGLRPGAYLVSARPRIASNTDITAPTDDEVDAALKQLQARRPTMTPASQTRQLVTSVPVSGAPGRAGTFVPVFYPAAFASVDAEAVIVRTGEERGGIDITVELLSAVVVTGQVTNLGNRPPSDIEVGLTKAGTAEMVPNSRTIARSDGSFRLAGITPGRYLLTARALSTDLARAALGHPADLTSPNSAPCAFAAEELQVVGTDITNIAMTLRPCLRIEGRLEFAGSGTPDRNTFTGSRMKLEGDRSAGVPMLIPLRVPAATSADGSFRLGEFADVLPGVFHLSVELPGNATARVWSLKSLTADGRDVLDSPLQVNGSSPQVISVVATLTDVQSSLSGTLETSPPRLPVEYTVVAFTTNRDWWRAPFRRVAAVRASANGTYTFKDLPPGEYFVTAMTDVAPDNWRDPDFLELSAPAAIRVTIGDGEQKIQNLRIR